MRPLITLTAAILAIIALCAAAASAADYPRSAPLQQIAQAADTPRDE